MGTPRNKERDVLLDPYWFGVSASSAVCPEKPVILSGFAELEIRTDDV